MALEYSLAPLPAVWPGKQTPAYNRRRAPFKSAWTKTLRLLEREIRMLDGRKVEFSLDVSDRDIRQDGQLRADARPRSPAVIVSFTVGADRLQFPCDRFGFWQDNVDAIGRALEALRMVDRYGVQQGRQYAGFKALPSAGGSTATMSAEAAAVLLSTDTITAADVLASHADAQRALRVQRARAHPDIGGSREKWDMIEAAAHRVAAHHGRRL